MDTVTRSVNTVFLLILRLDRDRRVHERPPRNP
jgi:hypothetical protein